MQPKLPPTQAGSALSSPEVFLRSINLCYDAEAPERIAHYYPTAKSIACLRALAGFEREQAFFIVAPYGSGKSITATYLLHLMENRRATARVLTEVTMRLARVSPDLRAFVRQRRQSKRFGLVLALHGSAHSLPQALKTAALAAMTRMKLGRQARALQQMPCDEIEPAIAFLKEVAHKVRAAGGDRLLILWDEFGRHLEMLLAEGRPSALLDIQLLAEFVSRAGTLPMTLGLLLHQDLLRYASHMPQSVRTEWTKIEGRFRTIQYIDDSKELYRLIAAVVAARTMTPGPPYSTLTTVVARCKHLGLFRDFSDEERLDLLRRAYPLEPMTLYLLPRLASRVAQHERTLFSFLSAAELARPIGPETLYDFFAGTMQADTAVGGTYRQWLETESALTKVGDNSMAAKVLKVACLLGLGVSGERARAGRALLDFAVQGYAHVGAEDTILTELMERKLLLHRRHNDEVTVWHGTDVDLRGRLEDEKTRQRDAFKLLDFLSHEAPPPVWRPVEYNDAYTIRRYLGGEYHTLSTLKNTLPFELQCHGLPVGCDGRMLYVLTETAEELRQAEAFACQGFSDLDTSVAGRLILVLLRDPIPLFETALEVACLLRMQVDVELIEADPFIAPELQHMTDDARSHLQRLLDRVVRPSSQGPRWFHQGEEFYAATPRDLRRALSVIMRRVFPQTPKINNEMIVRHRPSPQIVNARKKLLLGILERSGTANLGITGNFPDASMFRTVLVHTELYRPEAEDRWGYVFPDDVQDPGLQAVWQALHDFLTTPASHPKDFRPFFDQLMDPPFGLRAGLLPILLAAAFKAFPSARVLTRDGAYVTDILPSEIERLCREPEAYRLTVITLTAAQRAYLLALPACFQASSSRTVPDNDLIRECVDAFLQWKMLLPPAAFLTTQVTERTRCFQAVLRQQRDPVTLLFEAIPTACGHTLEQHELLLCTVTHCLEELMCVTTVYHRHAAAAVRRTLALGHDVVDGDVCTIAQRWATCFPDAFVATLTDGIAKGVLTRLRASYGTDEVLLESLASLIVGKACNRWDDSTIVAFDREFQQIVHRIEDAALASAVPLQDREAMTQGLAKLIHGRMCDLFARLVDLIGKDEAQTMLTSMQTAPVVTLRRKECHGDYA